MWPTSHIFWLHCWSTFIFSSKDDFYLMRSRVVDFGCNYLVTRSRTLWSSPSPGSLVGLALQHTQAPVCSLKWLFMLVQGFPLSRLRRLYRLESQHWTS
jgi:hypothetical protein